MHYYMAEDRLGDTIDAIPFCSDYCHRVWCEKHAKPYEGWHGAHEGPTDYPEYCEECGVHCNDVPETNE